MPRYIDAKYLENQVKDALGKINPYLMGQMLRWIRNQPSADVEPVRHGRWVSNGIPDSVLSKCSLCGIMYGSSSFNYCPNCGCKMEGWADNG